MYTVTTAPYTDDEGSGYVSDIVHDDTGTAWRVRGDTERAALLEAQSIIEAQSTTEYQCVEDGSELIIPGEE